MKRRTQPARRRRQVLRQTFDLGTDHEWRRYAGEPRRELLRTLRERFLVRHLKGVRGDVLELGPGPGRFTPLVRASTPGQVIAVDLSREGLREGRSRARRGSQRGRIAWVQAAGEHLPLTARSVDAVVVLGNILGMAAGDGPVVLSELARVLRPGGRLVADFSPPAASLQEFFFLAAQRRLLPRLLRRPQYYLIDTVLETGHQPYAPARQARWEFRFYTAPEAGSELARAGFRVTDLMSVAPLAAHQSSVAAIARRDPRTWETLLRLEETVGRRPGTLEAGHGFVLAARLGRARTH